MSTRTSDQSPVAAQQRRIEELIAALETLDDPAARESAQELLQVVLDLHANGLARLLEIVSSVGAMDDAMLEAFERDAGVSALLLLHGLHPQDLPTRVSRAVEKMRPLLGVQGIQIELLDAAEEAVRVKVAGRLQGKHNSIGELRQEIELAIFEAAPEATRVDIAGLQDVNVHELRFMPNTRTETQTRVAGRTEAGAQ
ncbi:MULTISPECIES: NifU family protein [unclassified Paraburkholderia]|uniref:NifU family protein n=1 Tax=unclassified Paraburkholderia TaxID=2615204 RepID=UPI000E3A41E4|nr:MULTISPECIES: NifU family protein [unclassified Paraburkholderia]REE19094.1 NifU-like protein [Paraburkholderia sp. BL27I4N3]RKR45777.1 NifU-like protein [Paraburkholderia sp. BL17N1]